MNKIVLIVIALITLLFDGTVEELDLDTWYELNLVAIEAPEDWSGSLDIEKQDYGVDLDESLHLDWGNPLDTFDA